VRRWIAFPHLSQEKADLPNQPSKTAVVQIARVSQMVGSEAGGGILRGKHGIPDRGCTLTQSAWEATNRKCSRGEDVVGVIEDRVDAGELIE
jgi:hypothetical protein